MSQAILAGIDALAGGAAGRILMNNGWRLNSKEFRGNDLLRKDEWKELDDVVVKTVRRELGAVQDLVDSGLVRTLGGLGVLMDEYERQSDITEAEQSMSGVTAGQQDQAAWELSSVPVPITFKDFSINLRQLEASRMRGAAIDTTNADLCSRRVSEKLEDTLFNGSAVAIGGNQIVGYTTNSSRITGSLTAAWTNASTRDIVQDVVDMIADAEAANFRGPFRLYCPVAYHSVLREDYNDAKGDRTYRERLLAIENLVGIRGTTSLTGEVVLVQMTRDVVDLSIAQDILTVNWPTNGGLTENFKVMGAMVGRVKVPYTGSTGIVHYSA